MQAIIFISNEIIDDFIISSHVPNGYNVFSFEPTWETIGSYTQLIIPIELFIELKENNKIRYNLPG